MKIKGGSAGEKTRGGGGGGEKERKREREREREDEWMSDKTIIRGRASLLLIKMPI